MRQLFRWEYIFFTFPGKLLRGDHMINNQQMLSGVLKTVQMGQTGIRCVMNTSMRPGLRKALESQLQEYDSIESEVHEVAAQRGLELSELPEMTQAMSSMMGRMKMMFGNKDSQIAGMMIQGNTRGMIKSLKDLHQFAGEDAQIKALSQKLLDTETANIRQMQPFL